MPSAPVATPSLPPFARDVIDLYASSLAEVRFPDVDLATLESCADSLREAQEEVERLDAELQAAQERVMERTATLLTRADRALSYARIFADDNAELSARIGAISGNVSVSSEEPVAQGGRKRGRPKKAAATADAQLDIAPDAQLDMAAED